MLFDLLSSHFLFDQRLKASQQRDFLNKKEIGISQENWSREQKVANFSSLAENDLYPGALSKILCFWGKLDIRLKYCLKLVTDDYRLLTLPELPYYTALFL